MTNLDGGLFTIHLAFSPRFPEEQPRAKFVFPLYHHQITSIITPLIAFLYLLDNRLTKCSPILADGIPCYIPQRYDEGRHHIDAIIQLMEEESPPYDPRTQVNQEASKLYWGSKEDKREYNKKLRRYVSSKNR